jgi:hypothetical protein
MPHLQQALSVSSEHRRRRKAGQQQVGCFSFQTLFYCGSAVVYSPAGFDTAFYFESAF